MTNEEIVRLACIKAQPEIVELKFGCYVKRRSNGDLRNRSAGKIGFVIKKYPNPSAVGVVFEGNETMSAVLNNEIEIIGRPIRLADILLAIGQSKKNADMEYGIRANGVFLTDFCEKAVFNENDEIIAWDLKNDDLSKQSPECLQFLAGILK